MKNIASLILLLIVGFTAHAQSFIGAWETTTTNKEGEKLKNVVLFSEDYQVSTWFHAETGEFISTNGGKWFIKADSVTELVEFDTKTPERVGSIISFKVFNQDSVMGIIGVDLTWRRVDNGTPGELNGAWVMSGRVKNDILQERDTNRPRKTMKVLSGTRFQWIAFNTETKQFMGTGGGSYSTINGKYTENIEFFSRDNSKVGKKLSFDYAIKEGNWHHSGYSSAGAPLYEIWSIRTK